METIEEAAIDFDDVVWTVPRPGRHSDVMDFIMKERPWITFVGGTQGFWTSKGRFVEREEARNIAEAAYQIIEGMIGPDGVPYKFQHRELFSEDVW